MASCTMNFDNLPSCAPMLEIVVGLSRPSQTSPLPTTRLRSQAAQKQESNPAAKSPQQSGRGDHMIRTQVPVLCEGWCRLVRPSATPTLERRQAKAGIDLCPRNFSLRSTFLGPSNDERDPPPERRASGSLVSRVGRKEHIEVEHGDQLIATFHQLGDRSVPPSLAVR